MPEAQITAETHGAAITSPGWFILNAAEAQWHRSAKFGAWCSFEGPERFPQFGINLHLLAPGQPACHYHRENQQENFMILRGACDLLIDGKKRRLKQWDFVHCPPGVEHVFVGAGDEDCLILMTGGRQEPVEVHYPRHEPALEVGAGVAEPTDDPSVSYAGTPKPETCPAPAL